MKEGVGQNINRLNINIRNNLRLLGFKSCNKSTKILAKTIFYIKTNKLEITDFNANEIYKAISKLYTNVTPKQVKDNINYALTYRNTNKSKTNFNQVFNFDYTEEIFTNKSFLEEFSNIIKIESKN